MTWAFVPAWALVAALALPLAAHLLSRHPPRRVPFPSLRFLRALPAVSRRVHTLHDRPLWALRSLLVLAIVVAAAGPTIETAARRASWRPEAPRANVTDVGHGDGEHRETDRGRTYVDTSLRHALAAAVADAPAAGPYEIVLKWDGRRAAIDERDLHAIPPHVGLTLERVAGESREAVVTDGPLVEILASPEETEGPAGASRGPSAAIDREPAVRVLEPGHVERDVWLDRAEPPDVLAWRLQERMRADVRLIDAAQRSRLDHRVAEERKPVSTFAPLARDADGAVIVWGASAAGRPLVVVDARPGDPVTRWVPVVAEGALWALGRGPLEDAPMWSDEEMALASRPGQSRGDMDLPGGLDTRTAWAAVLVLLSVEGWARRRVARRDDVASAKGDAA